MGEQILKQDAYYDRQKRLFSVRNSPTIERQGVGRVHLKFQSLGL